MPLILAGGYRVRSPRGTQFRQWATANLGEYWVKGFVMDDERLKEPGGRGYFDELLAHNRDICASEKRFYQKARDLFARSRDYCTDNGAAHRCLVGLARPPGNATILTLYRCRRLP
ncbi:RhuM family protein [Modicisalibacter tunisiensis]|uniref:RhuM family protein n=1 Tax=Modicisalibacter tunisiensis TaxID=390637 RepID=UPI001CCCDA5F|nr:RhuM family protein [Modicisalibacter tunisiensis]